MWGINISFYGKVVCLVLVNTTKWTPSQTRLRVSAYSFEFSKCRNLILIFIKKKKTLKWVGEDSACSVNLQEAYIIEGS